MTQPAKHTPGPWQVNDSTENDDDTTLTIFAPADEVEIATMSAYENGCECFSEIRENAHLIAAAPAMYEALREAQELIRSLVAEEMIHSSELQRVGNCQANMWQALSQAEGRQA